MVEDPAPPVLVAGFAPVALLPTRGAKGPVGSAKEGAVVREGDVIEIPVIGHWFRVLQSSRETGGGSLGLEWCAPPCGNAPEHVHPARRRGWR